MTLQGPTFRGHDCSDEAGVAQRNIVSWLIATIFRFFFSISISNEQYMNCVYRKGSSIQWVLAVALNTLMILWDISIRRSQGPHELFYDWFHVLCCFCIPPYLLVKGQLLCLQITGVFQLQTIGTHKQQILGAHREISRCHGGPHCHCYTG